MKYLKQPCDKEFTVPSLLCHPPSRLTYERKHRLRYALNEFQALVTLAGAVLLSSVAKVLEWVFHRPPQAEDQEEAARQGVALEVCHLCPWKRN